MLQFTRVPQLQAANRLRQCFSLVLLMTIAGAAGENAALGAERSHRKQAMGPNDVTPNDGVPKQRRRVRRHRSTSTVRSVASKRDRLRLKKAAEVSSGLYLSGSFHLNFGGNVISQGEGNLRFELDPDATEQLKTIVSDQINQMVPLANTFSQLIATLPETLQVTNQILTQLSEPDTQRNLQQVEQLLRLFNQLPAGSEVGK